MSSPDPLPAGRHELRFEFEPTGQPDLPHGKGAPGRLQLYVDGALVASADAPYTTPFMFNPGGVSCGHNPGSPVTPGVHRARSSSPAASRRWSWTSAAS